MKYAIGFKREFKELGIAQVELNVLETDEALEKLKELFNEGIDHIAIKKCGEDIQEAKKFVYKIVN